MESVTPPLNHLVHNGSCHEAITIIAEYICGQTVQLLRELL